MAPGLDNPYRPSTYMCAQPAAVGKYNFDGELLVTGARKTLQLRKEKVENSLWSEGTMDSQ